MDSIKNPLYLILLILVVCTLIQVYLSSNIVIRFNGNETRSIRSRPDSKSLPLVLLFEGGCSGSTAVGRFIDEIITTHGLKRYSKAGFEFMDTRRQWKNPIYYDILNETEFKNASKDEMLMESVERAKAEADELGQLFYFKVHLPKVQNKNRERLDEIGVSYVGIYRDNVLDRCICTTKDCFSSDAGYPVYKHNGTKADICFDRRKKPDAPAVITHFVDPINCLRRSSFLKKRIKQMDFPSVSEESLFGFEYTSNEDVWEESINVWMKILQPFLSTSLDKNILIEVVRKYRNTRPLPSPHKELVNDYKSLQDEIKNTTWATYLRE